MPSTYSSSLRLELQATGENANTWGTKTNNNLNLLQQAIAGYEAIDISGSITFVVSAADGVLDQARNAVLDLTGTVTSAISVVVPDVEKTYWVRCLASGADVTFRTSAGTGVVLPRDLWVFLVATGTSVINVLPPSALLSSTNTYTNINTFNSTVNLAGISNLTSTVNLTGTINVNGSVSVTDKTGFVAALGITSATQTSAGLVRFADVSAALAGTDTQRAVTPEGTYAVMSRIQQNVQATTTYTLVSADIGRQILHPTSASTTATYIIPSSASVYFPIGAAITLINQISAGPILLSITGDTLVFVNTGAAGARTLTSVAIATIIKVDAGQWMISGIGVT
jgi:hypothetical protein